MWGDGAYVNKKKSSDTLELELQKIVIFDMGAVSRTQVLWKINKWS